MPPRQLSGSDYNRTQAQQMGPMNQECTYQGPAILFNNRCKVQ